MPFSSIMCSFQRFLCLICVLLCSSPIFTISDQASDDYYQTTANLSTSWNNNISENPHLEFSDGSVKVKIILLTGTPGYAFGFYCNGNFETYLLAIFTFDPPASQQTSDLPPDPQVVWSADPNHPVGVNSTLNLTSDGDLVLKDVNGTSVWSTNTAGRSVAGLNLTKMGNLVLFDKNGATVWQSFDYPTDCLVPGQRLERDQKLTASVSLSNWTQGDIFLRVFITGLGAYINADPSQLYFAYGFDALSYVSLTNGSLAFYTDSLARSGSVAIPSPISGRYYMKLDYDGHLKVFELREKWSLLADMTAALNHTDVCDYPMVCGEYGICTNGQCSCPTSTLDSINYFKQIDSRQPNRGCSPITPLTCDPANDHTWLDLDDVGYFWFDPHITDADINHCKEVCSGDCSCKALIFGYQSNASSGNCHLLKKIFSLMNTDVMKTGYNYTVSIKVQGPRMNGSLAPIIELLSAIGAVALAVVGIGILIFIIRKKRKRAATCSVEDPVDEVPGTHQRTDEVSVGLALGMPRKFTWEELKSATTNFITKLGEGAFGSVFRGKLPDGMEIAVKWLSGDSRGKRSFVAEVKTIGRVQHVNVVKLIGYCADETRRILVYEYMKNGSLDKWINWAKNCLEPLDWNRRKKIILGIAKGLSYLHQDCWQKIVHLDIKPHNILLDEDFNAKISDFGLSKLMDKNQSSQVQCSLRGTPGYIAPEQHRTCVISEKVDVYPFGIVTLQILCSREVNETGEHNLVELFKTKAEEGRLLDMIDRQSEDMLSHEAEVLKMMYLVVWCLQGHYANRPSMSEVISVLEGHTDVKGDLGYDFFCHETAPIHTSTPSSGRPRFNYASFDGGGTHKLECGIMPHSNRGVVHINATL